MVKKLPFPDHLLNTNYIATFDNVGISEEGEPLASISKQGKCIFSEKSKVIINSDGTRTDLLGKVILKGDAAPTLEKIESGKIYIDGKEMDIYSCKRPRNPDGSIYSTNLEVM